MVDSLKTTDLELTGMMNKLTPVEIANAVRNPSNSCTMRLIPNVIFGKRGPDVKATFVKMLYMIAGNWRAGNFALRTFTNQMLAKSQMAQMAA